MSEHLVLRSSVGSRSSLLPSHQHQLPPTPDPLTSAWIRRFHLTPSPPPPPLPRCAPPTLHQNAVSSDESRTPPPPLLRRAGFGPFSWSLRPLLGAPVVAWDAAAAVSGRSGSVGGGPPMLSPFFRQPVPPPATPVAGIRESAPVRPLIGLGSGSYPGPSRRVFGGGDSHAAWLAGRAAGAANPSHALDMVPVRTIHDVHDRQHSVMPQNFARHDPSSSSQRNEPVSYWNMGRFRRNTTTSSISPIGVAPGSFNKRRNADSTSFLPLKLRKLGDGAI